jgi:RNA polymerase sigma-70 factor (ECF subfamily)
LLAIGLKPKDNAIKRELNSQSLFGDAMGHPSPNNPVPTPLSLLARLRSDNQGDHWRLFCDLYSGLIRRWFIRAGIPAVELDDLLQDSMLALVNGIRQFDHNGRAGAFRCWLKSVVVHRAATWFRRNRGRKEMFVSGLLVTIESINDRMLPSEWEKEHDQYVLQKLLRLVKTEVSETTWTAFYRQAFENASAATVALDLGISVNAALLAKSRVLRRLRALAEGLID